MDADVSHVPVVLITGPPGVGKSQVSMEASDLLERAKVPHAAIDLDGLELVWPTGDDDLVFRNLACLWANYAAGGASRLILTRVLETKDELAKYRAAVPGAEIVVCRLRAEPATLVHRIEARGETEYVRGPLQRHTVKLAKEMDEASLEDVLFDAETNSAADIAADLLDRVGWLRRRRPLT
jgi:MoxR-like ATPase